LSGEPAGASIIRCCAVKPSHLAADERADISDSAVKPDRDQRSVT
jgi:hypothetical protein